MHQTYLAGPVAHAPDEVQQVFLLIIILPSIKTFMSKETSDQVIEVVRKIQRIMLLAHAVLP